MHGCNKAARKALSLPSTPTDSSAFFHGDLHLNNLLYREDLGRLVVIDWEDVSPGSPAVDLLYLAGHLSGACGPTTRTSEPWKSTMNRIIDSATAASEYDEARIRSVLALYQDTIQTNRAMVAGLTFPRAFRNMLYCLKKYRA